MVSGSRSEATAAANFAKQASAAGVKVLVNLENQVRTLLSAGDHDAKGWTGAAHSSPPVYHEASTEVRSTDNISFGIADSIFGPAG